MHTLSFTDRRKVHIVLVPLIVVLFASCGQHYSDDEKDVITVVEQFFHGLAARDSSLLRSVMLPQGTISSIREADGQAFVRTRIHEDFFQSIAVEENDLLERMWEPEVLIEGRVATLWTQYDFYLNGSFSHCGIDVFTLLKVDEGWKIAGAVYSVVKTGCDESPLGPPKSLNSDS